MTVATYLGEVIWPGLSCSATGVSQGRETYECDGENETGEVRSGSGRYQEGGAVRERRRAGVSQEAGDSVVNPIWSEKQSGALYYDPRLSRKNCQSRAAIPDRALPLRNGPYPVLWEPETLAHDASPQHEKEVRSMTNLWKKSFPLFVFASLSFYALPIPAAAPVVYEPHLPGMALGNGYDIYSSQDKLSCVNYKVVPTNAPGAIRFTNYYFNLVESNANLLELTGINAAASVDAGYARASAELALLWENQIVSYDVSALSLVDVELRWDMATEVTLKPEYQKILLSNPAQFFEMCGTKYVSTMIIGGSFYNTIKISTRSRSDRDEVAANISGGWGSFAASVDASNKTLATLASRQATIRGYAAGGGGVGIPMDLNSMVSRVSNYPAEVQASGGTMIGVFLEDYPTTSLTVDLRIWKLAMMRWDYTSLLKAIEYIQSHPNEFYMDLNSWTPVINVYKSQVNSAIGSLDQAIQQCRLKGGACAEPTGLPPVRSIQAGLPPRYVGVCGWQNFTTPINATSMNPLPLRCGGDTDMKGHSPTISISSEFRPADYGKGNRKGIDLFTYVRMKEGQADWTCFEGKEFRTLLLDLDMVYPGCSLYGPLPSGSLNATSAPNNHEWTRYQGTGLIQSANCLSDTSGDDFGKVGCKSIYLRDTVLLSMAHDEDLMGPNIYKTPSSSSPVYDFSYAYKIPVSHPFSARYGVMSNYATKKVILPMMLLK